MHEKEAMNLSYFIQRAKLHNSMWDNSNNDNGLQDKTRTVRVKEYASEIRRKHE
jgi:hypothetical protein